MGPRAENPRNGIDLRRIPKANALVVGEDPGDFPYYVSILEVCGYRVQVCNTFREGLLRLSAEAFDFAMVIQGTPKFEWRDVLKCAQEINRSLPVLVVARSLDPICYREAKQLGAVAYLVEPVSVSVLIRVLERHPPVRTIAPVPPKVREQRDKEGTAEGS